MANSIITGIDIGSDTIKVITAASRDEGHHARAGERLVVLGAGIKKSKGVRNGYIVDIDDTVSSIRDAVLSVEKLSGTQIKNAYVSIGGISLQSVIGSSDVIAISKADGEITDYDMNRAINKSEESIQPMPNRKILHTIPLVFILDGSQILGRAVGMHGSKLEVKTLFITVLTQHMRDTVRAVELANIAVERTIAAPIAASRATLTKIQREAGCVLANIGAGTVSVVVYEENSPISLMVSPIGSRHITNDIALGMQMSLDEAEEVKRSYDTSMPNSYKRKLSDIIDARLSDIFEIIGEHLKKIKRSGMLPAGIILTGGGSNLMTLEDIAKYSMQLPASLGTAKTGDVKFDSKIPKIKESVLSDPEWTTALGLCTMGMSDESETSHRSILPTKIKQAIKRTISAIMP